MEETLNAMLDAEADQLCGAKRYEHSADRLDTRAGHYERQLHTQAGAVTLRVPKLRKLPFETAIIERYQRREISVEEALVEMYLAGVSVRRVEDSGGRADRVCRHLQIPAPPAALPSGRDVGAVGCPLSRQTMVEWVRIAADWAEPIYKLMLAELLKGRYVQCDETPVKFIDPDEKGRGTIQGYLWVISAPGGDVVFDWRLTRRHGELTALLTDDYAGLMQSDGYEAYAAYARSHPGVVWLGCWAHARRRFFEAQQEHPRIARAALRLIGRLYRREREWDERHLSPEQRAAERAKPEGLARTMQSLRRLALWARQRVLPKSTLGKARDYLLNQCEPLVRHLHHGESRLDNNWSKTRFGPRASARRTGCSSATPKPASVRRSCTR